MSIAILEFSSSLSRTLVIFCFSAILLLIYIPISIAQAEDNYNCSVIVNECKEPIRAPSRCFEKISFLERLFGTSSLEWCVQKEEVQYRYEQEIYLSCLAQQKSRRERCKILMRQRDLDIVTKKISDDAPLRENGVICKESSECKSGYCLPGPDINIGGSENYYCMAEHMNCAWPGEEGYKYGKPLDWGPNNIPLTCENPGEGRWAQFYKNK